MLRKIAFGALTLLLALFMVGCGDDNASENATTPKPEGNADKAVLAYAQLYAYGIIEDENMAAAGMTEAEVQDIQNQVLTPLVQAFQGYPLSEENVAEILRQYVAKMHIAMNMKTRVKNDDSKNPVVELTASTVNKEETATVAEADENLIALGVALGQLQSEGFTDEQIKSDPEFQSAAMEAINKFLDELPLNAETSIDVPCEAIKGSDGKMYWAPKNPEAVAKFVSGQN